MEHSSKGAIGFIGLGTMGREMARNLVSSGFEVRAYDVRDEAVAEAATHGASAVRSVAEAARGADAVITMLPNTPHVESVLLAADGLLATPPRGGLIIDMSTIAPHAARRMHAACAKVGLEFLDAPVSGGPQGARDATLTIMVGGAPNAFERAKPIFSAMGATITRVGEAGAGQTVKLCNQLVCGINIQAVCEAIALARASGIDLTQMREVLLGGAASSWMLDRLGPAMIAGDAHAGFRIELMLKDLALVNDLARDLAVPLPATALVTSQYMEARAHGEDANGNQALFRVYDRMSNQRPA